MAYFVTLGSPWAQLTYSTEIGPIPGQQPKPPTAEELLHGNDTIRALGTTSLLICLALLLITAGWVLAPAFARRPVRWPVPRRAVTVVLAAWPAFYTTLLVWQTFTSDLMTPTPFGWASAVVALAVLAIAVAQYRAETRRREMRELAKSLAELVRPPQPPDTAV